jgi:hypothetical protein
MLLPLPVVVGSTIAVIVGLVSGSWILAIVTLIVVALAVAVAAFYAADYLALRLLGARPLAEGATQALRNQLEELCARAGVAEPDLYTVGAGEPAIASCGRARPAFVVTDGLTESLTVVELEAAVARELARVRSGAGTVDTLAVPFVTLPLAPFGHMSDRVLNWFRGGDHDAKCDLDGIAITRYPPGLSEALKKMRVPGGKRARSVAHLWAVGGPTTAKAGTFGIEERLELLSEL